MGNNWWWGGEGRENLTYIFIEVGDNNTCTVKHSVAGQTTISVGTAKLNGRKAQGFSLSLGVAHIDRKQFIDNMKFL